MRFAVRYQSEGGNTRAVAEAIARTLGVEAQPIDRPLEEPVDVLFVGGGVYKFHAPKSVLAFIAALDKDKVGRLVAFSTASGMETTIRGILRAAEERGIPTDSRTLLLRMGTQGFAMMGREGGHLTDEQIGRAEAFAAQFH